MANLQTTYLGKTLKNPFIVGASNLSTDAEKLKKLEGAGASAVVYKSLFEEQIHLENLQLYQQMSEYADRNAEVGSLFPDMEHAGPEEFLMNLSKARKSVSIPMFASINAVYRETWIEYAKKIEATGVDGIEVNFYSIPGDFTKTSLDIENDIIAITKEIKSSVGIPVSIKLSPNYTNILNLIKQLDQAGADGIVYFNRLFQPDIDLGREVHHFPYYLSNSDDSRLALRYSGLLYGEVNASLCAGNGIMSATDAIKMILAGATCVQVVSTLYKNKIDYLSTMISEMEQWMNMKGYTSLDEIRGKLSKKSLKDPFVYKRAQYVDALFHSDEIFKNYPAV
jgi:dihydroorotate dehydrogenase (fumarate)